MELLVGLLILGYVVVEFLLLLLHSPVVDLLEVPLLPQLIVGGARFLSDDPSLVQVLLKDRQLVGEGLVDPVDFRDVWQFARI